MENFFPTTENIIVNNVLSRRNTCADCAESWELQIWILDQIYNLFNNVSQLMAHQLANIIEQVIHLINDSDLQPSRLRGA